MLSKQLARINKYQLKNSLINKFNIFIDETEKKLSKKSEKIKDNTIKNENERLIVNEKDKLFWIFFIIKNGFLEYELLNNKTFIIEKNEKIKLIEKIRKEKAIIKSKKWKINILESELVDDKPISISTFLCCCFINNINIILKKNCSIYHLKFNDTTEEVIEYSDLGFSLNLNRAKNNILVNDFLKNYFIITNINKPIKAISNYKLPELHEICEKLKINIKNEAGKKYKKVELYEIIKTKI